MGFLQKLLGSKDPLAALRRAAKQERWADALREYEVIQQDQLPAEALNELRETFELAGNCLAEINLREGDACLRAGDLERARELFQLALKYACSDQLKSRAEQLMRTGVPSTALPLAETVPAAKSCCSSGCHSGESSSAMEVAEDMDLELRLELALASYPQDMAVRYAACSTEFKEALLLAFEGESAEALKALAGIDQAEQNDLYQFEQGSLLIRLGQTAQGRRCLEKAIALNPQHHLAQETLVTLDLMEKQLGKAESRLNKMLVDGISSTFCFSRLAQISAAKNDLAAAISYGEKALASGPVELDILVQQSALLERTGRIAEAESILSALPAGGCGGGAHYLLAEFWLRHGKSLNRALEAFKSVSRSEPANLLWPLRIAHTYFALGWNKDAQSLMHKVLSAPALSAELRKEAEGILSFYGK